MTGTVSAAQTHRPQLVIFDLDGTLTDSADGIVSSFRHALGEIGAAVPDGDLAGRIVGPPMHQTLSAMGLGEHADEPRSPPIAPTTRRVVGRSTACSTGSGRCWPTCGPRVCGLRWPPPKPSRPPDASSPTSVSTGTSRWSPAPASTAPAPARPTWWRTPWPNCSRCPSGCSWSATARHDVEGAAAHGIDTVVVGWGYGRADFADHRAGTGVVARRDRRRTAEGVGCLTGDCTSPSSARATSAGRRWPRRCSPTRSRARPARRGAGDQRGNRRLARRQARRRAGQPRAARARLPDRPPRRAGDDDHLAPTWSSRWAATTFASSSSWGSTPTGSGCCGRSTPVPALMFSTSTTPTTATTTTSKTCFAVIEASLPGLHDWVDERLGQTTDPG